MDAVALARDIRAKRVSPTEVVEAVLARMERLDPVLHAFCNRHGCRSGPECQLLRIERLRHQPPAPDEQHVTVGILGVGTSVEQLFSRFLPVKRTDVHPTQSCGSASLASDDRVQKVPAVREEERRCMLDVPCSRIE